MTILILLPQMVIQRVIEDIQSGKYKANSGLVSITKESRY